MACPRVPIDIAVGAIVGVRAARAATAALPRSIAWMTTGAISGVLRGRRRARIRATRSGYDAVHTADRFLDDVDHGHDHDGRAQGVQKLERFTGATCGAGRRS